MLWSGITSAVIQFPSTILSQGITVKMPHWPKNLTKNDGNSVAVCTPYDLKCDECQ